MAKVLLDFSADTRNMQFDREEDCRQIYRMFGEGEALRERFPLFYEALRQGQKGTPDLDSDCLELIIAFRSHKAGVVKSIGND